MKILYFKSEEIKKTDIVWGLLELKLDVEISDTIVKLHHYDDTSLQTICQEVKEVDCCITQNFSVMVAEACYRVNTPYIAWVYDSPQRALYMKEALYDTNYIFMFDSSEVEHLKAVGITNVFYMPLAANVTRSSTLAVNAVDRRKYGGDVSFVGSLYQRPDIINFYNNLPQDILISANDYIANSLFTWEKTKDLMVNYNQVFFDYVFPRLDHTDMELYNVKPQFWPQFSIMAPMMTSIEREAVLRELSFHSNVVLNTHKLMDGTDLGNTKVRGTVDSTGEVYKVYASSKVNLNLTYRAIATGVPQRVLDIMSIRGFVLTNYQEDASSMFMEDRDIVFFRSVDELIDKAVYYINNDTPREKIASNGFRKVSQEYTYAILLQKILKIAMGKVK